MDGMCTKQLMKRYDLPITRGIENDVLPAQDPSTIANSSLGDRKRAAYLADLIVLADKGYSREANRLVQYGFDKFNWVDLEEVVDHEIGRPNCDMTVAVALTGLLPY